MTSEPDLYGKNKPTPNAKQEADDQADQSNAGMPQTSSISTSPPTKVHYQVTCKPEKGFWDKFKTRAEIVGIGLLAVYTAYTIKMYGTNKQAADAAKSAADTAKETLYISQRAYVSQGSTQIDAEKKMISFSIVNSGHIPSGKVDASVYEATFNSNGSQPTSFALNSAVERHRSLIHIGPISSGSIGGMTIPAPQMSLDRLKQGSQLIMVVGTISYNDGFPDSPTQQSLICAKTVYQTVAKTFYLAPCDATGDLPKFESLDWTAYTTTYP